MHSDLIEQLNASAPDERLDALRELARMYAAGALKRPEAGDNVNNHIHTIYSFSPYSPAKAVFLAWESGLATAGIMDHDSVAGAPEFIEAGRIIGLPVTVGFECRCSVSDTPFDGKRLNNPDQISVAYVAMHGIPRHMLGEAEDFLAPYRKKRNARNRKIVDNLNARLRPYGMALDFDRDVLPQSQFAAGGSVTERHILYSLAAALTENKLQREFLLGQFKSSLIESVYVDADEELPHISEFVALAGKLGAIPAYAYLGDVGQSVTGDKKKQTFEDPFLEGLIDYLKAIGMLAVTYMPARNSDRQLERIKALCGSRGLFQISGEDINSPLQSFVCEKIETPGFRHLIDSAWALIGHELASESWRPGGMFSAKAVADMPNLEDRVRFFADYARRHCQ